MYWFDKKRWCGGSTSQDDLAALLYHIATIEANGFATVKYSFMYDIRYCSWHLNTGCGRKQSEGTLLVISEISASSIDMRRQT